MNAVLTPGLNSLWKTCPAFIISIHLLLGVGFSLSWNVCIFLIHLFVNSCLLLHWQKISWPRLATSFFTFIFGVILGCTQIEKDQEFNEPIKGWITFIPSSIKIEKSMFQSYFSYQGKGVFCSDDDSIVKVFPIHLVPPKDHVRPSACNKYLIRGELKKISKSKGEVNTEGPWIRLEPSLSLAEWRFSIKNIFKTFVYHHIHDKKVANFFFSLCSGEIDDKMLSFYFSRLGLQHILAVSGFHFSLIATFFGGIFYFIFPKKSATILLMIALTAYFIFLGYSPSIFRAWLAISIWSLAQIFSKKNHGLNTLGISLLFELILFPNHIYHIGFQFSFLCTASLLIIYPILKKWTSFLLPQRNCMEIARLSMHEKFIYLMLVFFKPVLAVTAAVHLASIFLCFYHFQSFPLLSLPYNLFFPLFTGICLFMFLAGLILSVIFPFLSKWVFQLNTQLTGFLLDTSFYAPKSLARNLYL
ncbi:MAG: ComEC/Rec2 family competence protein, partial [Chlamydiae bacterium]|nr:ComEC/Rec2 family competence protein [Chlamydiota bacterium]